MFFLVTPHVFFVQGGGVLIIMHGRSRLTGRRQKRGRLLRSYLLGQQTDRFTLEI